MLSDSIVPEHEGARVRGVTLLPDEAITCVFSPDLGLIQAPPLTGQVLVVTSQRVLAFYSENGRDETFLSPLEEITRVTVKSASRKTISILQGISLTVVVGLLYLIVAYWLTGRFDGPGVTLINMDLGPLLVLLLALAVGGLMACRYFPRKDGSILFQGNNWSFEFPYRDLRTGQEISQVVEKLFGARQSAEGDSILGEDSPESSQSHRPL